MFIDNDAKYTTTVFYLNRASDVRIESCTFMNTEPITASTQLKGSFI